jgi:hypothetical protein
VFPFKAKKAVVEVGDPMNLQEVMAGAAPDTDL